MLSHSSDLPLPFGEVAILVLAGWICCGFVYFSEIPDVDPSVSERAMQPSDHAWTGAQKLPAIETRFRRIPRY